jgi:hypothetical protein
MVGTEESFVVTFCHNIQLVSFSFDFSDIKGPFDMFFGSGVV